MAHESNMNLYTLPASGALSQYRGVTVDANGRAASPSAGTPVLVGVTQNASTAIDSAVTIALPGSITKLEFAGSTMSVGERFTINTAGRGQASTGAAVAGIILAGSSGTTGRINTVLLSYSLISTT